jgi:type I restriction enzyme S subunit
MMFYKETNFKETPIGRIPKDWEVSKLEKICEKIKAGGTPLTTKKEFWNGNIPFVKIEDMTSYGKYLMKTSSSITKAGLENSNAWLVPENSLLLAMYGSLGEVSINTINVATNQAILGIIPKEKDDVEFLYYWFLYFKPCWRKFAKPTTQANLTAEIVRNSTIPLPPSQERKKIAEILSTIDEAIQKTNEIIAKTERLKKGLMQELLTKGIGHKEFKNTEIGRIPKEWRVVKLGEIGTFQYGITASAKEEDTGVKFLRITDIRDNGTINWSEVPFCEISISELSKYMLKVGDVLFARIGATTGKTCYINQEIRGVFGSYLIRFLPDVNSQINTKFLHLFTQSEMYWLQVNRMKGGQLKKGLNTQLLKEIKILLPPLEEQWKIVQVLSTVDKKLEIERNEKAKLENIKQGLMDLLLTGKIRVKVS